MPDIAVISISPPFRAPAQLPGTRPNFGYQRVPLARSGLPNLASEAEQLMDEDAAPFASVRAQLPSSTICRWRGSRRAASFAAALTSARLADEQRVRINPIGRPSSAGMEALQS
jgi:hypothetical protein